MIDPNDLLNATEVAAQLGLKHREAIATYRRRYPNFPPPIVDKGTCVLWAQSAVESWSDWRARAKTLRGPLVWCRRIDGEWEVVIAGLPTVAPVPRDNDFATVEGASRAALDDAFQLEMEPEFRLSEPTPTCVYCGGAIEHTGTGRAVNGQTRMSGRCTQGCDVRYRSAGLLTWDLG